MFTIGNTFCQDSFFDVHVHLTHSDFKNDVAEVISRAENVGVNVMVVNGTNPKDNREVLSLAAQYSSIWPSIGIYPSDAVNHLLPSDFPYRVERFDVNEEIKFIGEQAKLGNIAAIGECGLDGHMLDLNTFKEQESVFMQLLEIGKEFRLPVIVHSRKLEERTLELVKESGHNQVDFHCFSGRTKWAIQAAEKYGWCFSIPSNAVRNDAFKKLLLELPKECILTETDAPYLAPIKGARNEPATVVETIKVLAEVRGWEISHAKTVCWKNLKRLFAIS